MNAETSATVQEEVDDVSYAPNHDVNGVSFFLLPKDP